MSKAACPSPCIAIMDYMHEVKKYDKTAADTVPQYLDALDGKIKPQDNADEMLYDVISKFYALSDDAK